MSKGILLILLAVAIISGIVLYYGFFQNRAEISMVKVGEINEASPTDTNSVPRLSTIAANLEIPWALVFLPASPLGRPNRSILFTERPGRVRLIDNKGNLNPTPIAVIDDVLQEGEGGLLGITIHPDFSKNSFVYLYYTYANNNRQTLNRVVRFKFENNTLSDKTTIVDAIPGALFHNGGRIKFGSDGFLYITTGDSQNPSLAQDKNSLAGKILRVTDDGRPAPNNPFGNEVFSFGHRNSQGIAWDKDNRLFSTEHGASALDEINVIEKGKNYGWPVIRGNQTQNGMQTPMVNSRSDTWAPSGAAYLNGSIFFAGLRGQALFEYNIETKNLTSHLKGEIGRIREVVLGPDNLLYITTSNRDGRGIPGITDDKIILVNPTKL